jgi:hypothetical protein
VAIVRRAASHAQLAVGRVELNLISGRQLPIVIDGYLSCNEDLPCPAGTTCQQNQLCR